jgi:copper transport protein
VRLRAALILGLAALLALPAVAFGHAELIEVSPGRGEQLDEAPRRVTFRFSESVEASFGGVRVFDGTGKQVDDGRLVRPGGRGDTVGVGLRAGLGPGTYTATYRVISADSHPISGGSVFVVGEGGAAGGVTVSELLDEGEAGPVTDAGFGIVRGLAYAAMALVLGGLLFVLVVWGPALRGLADASDAWRDASIAFAARAQLLLAIGVVAGVATSLLGLVFQGATAAGTTFWAALDPNVIDQVLDTRFGTVWAVRGLLWLVLGLVVLWPRPAVRMPTLLPARLGADGTAVGSLPPPPVLAALAVLAVAIAITPGLAGHAGSTNPEWLILGIDTLHVLAMCAWVGTLAFLLGVLPAATRRLEAPSRTRLLAAAVMRVSPIALASVIVLLATGIGQSIAHLEAVADLWNTGFGRAILVKGGLLIALCAIGAWHRRRSIPRLRALAAAGEPPASAGLTLRRALRAEIVLFVGVLSATSVLVATSPATAGPSVFSDRVAAGPAEIEVTMEPLRLGANEIHLYFFNRSDGSQLSDLRRVDVELRQPAQGIGPLPVRMSRAGPGHFVSSGADIGVPGEWEMTMRARLSEFDVATARVTVEVE